MPDETIITPKAESPPLVEPEDQTLSSARTQLVNLCALGLGISFFLPWAHILFGDLSGFDLQKLGEEQRLLWAIPIFCAITIFAGVAKQNQNFVARITGLLPFLVGAYWYNKIGSDLTHALTYGAFLSLIFGAALLILPQRAK